MLKFETTEVPAGLENYYESTGTGYRLKVEGAVPVAELDEQKNKLKEFRENNIALTRKNDELARFEQMFQSGEFSSEKISAKIDEQAKLKALEIKAAYDRDIQENTEKLNGVQEALRKTLLDAAVTKAAIGHGVAESALPDVFTRAKDAFTVLDGKLKASSTSLDENGSELTVESWMKKLVKDAPHFFNSSRGSSKSSKVIGSTQMSAIDKIRAGRLAMTK